MPGARNEPADALDETIEERLDLRRDGDVEVRLAAPRAAPVGHRLAACQRPGELDLDGQRLRPRQRRVEGAATASASWMKAP